MTSLPGQNISKSDGTSEETAWTRLSTAFKYATSRVQMDKEVPDPPPELKEWSQNTSLGVFAGLMFGGGTQWLRDRQAGPWQPPATSSLNKAALARLQAEESSRKLVRLANETLRGGLRFGALAGLFYAVQQVSSIARAEKGLQDIIVAGTATGAVFGATVLGSKGLRARSSALGTALGAGAGIIGGLLQETLISYLPEEEQRKYHMPPSIPVTAAQQKELEDRADEKRHPGRHPDATAAVIAQLQGSLDRNRPAVSRATRPDL